MVYIMYMYVTKHVGIAHQGIAVQTIYVFFIISESFAVGLKCLSFTTPLNFFSFSFFGVDEP